MKNTERYKSTTALLDLLFNALIGVVFLFIIAFLLIKPEEPKKEDFERKAEFVIILEWDKNRVEDMDLWVQDPNGGSSSCRAPRVNFMHLDKDDLGGRNDTAFVNGEQVTIKINREVTTIRGIIPGEYIVNAHLFSRYSSRYSTSEEHGFPVTIEVIKVNPRYEVVFSGEHIFNIRGQEETFVRFVVSKDGKVESMNHLKKVFVIPAGTSSTP